jgi:glycine C-acetyltransferase/8-amino-7-oxononanoate synthase
VCREHEATLLVDVAHDLGQMGPSGTGQLGIQNVLGKVDLVMGSFSKTFASNGGFLATHSAAVKQFAKMYGNPHIFSNALSPVQTAVVRKALDIVRSTEGVVLRKQLLGIVTRLRSAFSIRGISCLGQPCAIVPVPIGDEKVARVAHRLLRRRNIAAIVCEYPAVATGAARFRLQVMASHGTSQAHLVAQAIAEVIEEAREIVQNDGALSERVLVAAKPVDPHSIARRNEARLTPDSMARVHGSGAYDSVGAFVAQPRSDQHAFG